MFSVSSHRGVARIFQRGGHTGSNNIVMAFSPRNIAGCLLKKRLQRGGHGHPRTPLATPLSHFDETIRIIRLQARHGNHHIANLEMLQKETKSKRHNVSKLCGKNIQTYISIRGVDFFKRFPITSGSIERARNGTTSTDTLLT